MRLSKDFPLELAAVFFTRPWWKPGALVVDATLALRRKVTKDEAISALAGLVKVGAAKPSGPGYERLVAADIFQRKFRVQLPVLPDVRTGVPE